MSTAGNVMSMSVREWQEVTGYGAGINPLMTIAERERQKDLEFLSGLEWPRDAIQSRRSGLGWKYETEEEYQERVMEAIRQLGRP